jgi:hypothetical protein
VAAARIRPQRTKDPGELHDRGVLTDAEFELQKQKLLGE